MRKRYHTSLEIEDVAGDSEVSIAKGGCSVVPQGEGGHMKISEDGLESNRVSGLWSPMPHRLIKTAWLERSEAVNEVSEICGG